MAQGVEQFYPKAVKDEGTSQAEGSTADVRESEVDGTEETKGEAAGPSQDTHEVAAEELTSVTRSDAVNGQEEGEVIQDEKMEVVDVKR